MLILLIHSSKLQVTSNKLQDIKSMCLDNEKQETKKKKDWKIKRKKGKLMILQL